MRNAAILARLTPKKGVAPKTCQWIEGDPKIDRTMCAKQSMEGRPWCREHARRAYQPPKPKP